MKNNSCFSTAGSQSVNPVCVFVCVLCACMSVCVPWNISINYSRQLLLGGIISVPESSQTGHSPTERDLVDLNSVKVRHSSARARARTHIHTHARSFLRHTFSKKKKKKKPSNSKVKSGERKEEVKEEDFSFCPPASLKVLYLSEAHLFY